jgi:arylsulfatase A-like enzyme
MTPLCRGRARGLRVLLLAVSGTASLIGLACGAEPSPREGTSVVLVLVDQLRKDAADRWMPQVAALARRGVVFENLRSVAPWTYPSVISLFSGLYPQQHGADGHPYHDRVTLQRRRSPQLTTFDPGIPLLQGLLKRAGYYTAGFVTNPFLQTWNPFHAGFDHYDIDGFVGSQGNLRGFPKLVWTRNMFADSVNTAVIAHFDARPLREPEFTYVHYIDAHGPWEGAPFPGGYESAVRYLGPKVLQLYEYFATRYGDDLLFIVTSDHGREFGDDLEIGEGRPWRRRKHSMHDFNLHIPLWVLPGRRVPQGRVVREAAASIDVLPTLLDWLDLEPPASLPGISLLPAVEGGSIGADRALYARMSAFNRLDDAIVYRGRKYVRYRDPQTREEKRRAVFDLAADPREARSLGDDFGAAAALLESSAGTHGVEYPARFESPPDEVLESLQALGYLIEE